MKAAFGSEQAGRRPALVLSPKVYNAKSGPALACPITNQAKGYPFEAAVPAGCGAAGVLLTDHLKSIDWKARRAERLGRCSDEAMGEVRAKPSTQSRFRGTNARAPAGTVEGNGMIPIAERT